MRKFVIFCLLCLQVTSSFGRSFPTSELDEPRLFLVFGDSYADTGNLGNTTSGWNFPYGITWPGSPSGRFSNGFVQTDFLAPVLGVQSPTPNFQIPANITVSGGINFALGGSGATFAFGVPTLEAQVGFFAARVKAGYFTPEALNRAVVLVSTVGNDYSAYNGSSLEGYFDLSHEVPFLIDQSMRTLYSLGARNFMVSTLPPLSCLPARTAALGFAECENNVSIEAVIGNHNHFLEKRLENITNSLDNSSILYLQQTKAMSYVLDNLSDFNITEGLKPCCVGSCGSVDASGNPLFEVCDDPNQHFFWDNVHPTQAGWKAVVELYTNHSRFTKFSPRIKSWLDSLSP